MDIRAETQANANNEKEFIREMNAGRKWYNALVTANHLDEANELVDKYERIGFRLSSQPADNSHVNNIEPLVLRLPKRPQMTEIFK